MEPTRQESTARLAHFSLWDTICIIVGIIIGAGIFRTPGDIFALSGGAWMALLVWVAGGLLAIIGAFCFAELASTYPRSGGEYVYLSRAFGQCVGFLFAWSQLLLIRTGASIVAMAFVFADFAVRLANVGKNAPHYPYVYVGLALGSVLVLTLTNAVGVRTGKWTQNTLTIVKVLGLVGVFAVGVLWARSDTPGKQYVIHMGAVKSTTPDSVVLQLTSEPRTLTLGEKSKITIDGRETNKHGAKLQASDLQGRHVKVLALPDNPTEVVRVKATDHSGFGAMSLALILVLWTYAGWHEGAYIAAEVRNRRRNLPLALLLGTVAVIAIYVGMNLAYLRGFGYEDAADAKELGADILKMLPWTIGSRNVGEVAICLLIMISSLGAINGIIFTSSRIFSEFGADHALFAPLGKWHGKLGTPLIALLVQGLVSVATIIAVAFFFPSQESFDAVVRGTAPVFWLFFLLTGFALFALRRLDRGINRPFSTPLYPLTPLVYCAFCGMMLYGSVVGAFEEELSGWFVLVTALVVLMGVPLYFLSRHTSRQGPEEVKVEQQLVSDTGP